MENITKEAVSEDQVEVNSAYNIMLKQRFSAHFYKVLQQLYRERPELDRIITDDLRDCIWQMELPQLQLRERTSYEKMVNSVIKDGNLLLLFNIDKVLNEFDRDEMIQAYRVLTDKTGDSSMETKREMKDLLLESLRELKKTSKNKDLIIKIKKFFHDKD